MNENFSFSRFWNLCVEHWMRNWRIIVTVLVLSILAIGFGLYWTELSTTYTLNKYGMVQWSVFHIGYLILQIITGFVWYNRLSESSAKTNYFMLPASTFEKFAHAFTWNILIISLAYIILFLVFNAIIYKWAIHYEELLYNKDITRVNDYFKKPEFFNPIKDMDWIWMLKVVSLQTIILICTLKFNRYAIIKTIFFILAFLYFYIANTDKINNKFLVPKSWEFFNSGLYSIINRDYEEYHEILSPTIFKTLIEYNFIPFFVLAWISIYFILKEKEV